MGDLFLFLDTLVIGLIKSRITVRRRPTECDPNTTGCTIHVFLIKRDLSGRKLLFFQLGLGSQLSVLGILRLVAEIDDTGFLILVDVNVRPFSVTRWSW